MGGLIGTGLSYQDNAMGGFIRESAEQQQIDQANETLQFQKEEQDAQLKMQEDASNKQLWGTVGGMGAGRGAAYLMMALFP